MNKSIIFYLLLLFPILGFGQTERQELPNWIQRQLDFEDRRSTPEDVNFAKSYYKAYQTAKNHSYPPNKNGDEWTPLGPHGYDQLTGLGRVNTMQFHPTDTNTWFICVAQGGIWKTEDAGESWTDISSNLPIQRTTYLAINPENPDIMYLATGDFAYLGHNLQANENKRNSHYGLGIYKTKNGGKSWYPTGLSFAQTDFEGSLIDKIFIKESEPNTLLAVGQTGAYVSTDSGANWTQTHKGLFWDMEKDPSSDSIVYASTGYVFSYDIGYLSVLKTKDFGISWDTMNIDIPSTISAQRIELAVAPSSPQTIYAIACDSIGGFFSFYRSTDFGETFIKRMDRKNNVNLLNWNMDMTPGGQGRYDLSICVDKDDPNKVWVGGINIWQTDNGGASFQPLSYWRLNYLNQSLHADVHEIRQHPSNHTLFACHDGGLSRAFNLKPNTIDEIKDYADTEWIDYTVNLNITSFYRLSTNPLNKELLIAGAQDNNTVFRDENGFTTLSGGDGMESAFHDEYNYRYTSSQNGAVYAFYYIEAANTMYYDGTVSKPQGEIGEWTTPFKVKNDKLYIGYGNLYSYLSPNDPQKLSNFSNSGNMSFPAPIVALDLAISNETYYIAKRGYISKEIKSEVWVKPSSGEWTNITGGLPDHLYPSYIQVNPQNSDEAWICFSGFDSDQKVFHTTNGGDSWDNITFNLPNIPVNCILYHRSNNGTIYIGTDLGVYTLPANTESWKLFSEGLPPIIVSELEINEAKKTLVAATFGRGLWEIGISLDSQEVSIQDVEQLSQIDIIPNPAHEFIEVSLGATGEVNYEIVDATGHLITSHKIENGIARINTTGYSPGLYYLIFYTSSGRFVKKILIH